MKMGADMNFNEIKELNEWLDKSSFTAYSLSINGVHISISKQQHPTSFVQAPLAISPLTEQQMQTSALAQGSEAPFPATTTEIDSPTSHIITSPIVGIFYEAENPESTPFVQVGQRVQKGDPLCILEAMKAMNTISSDVDGVVVEIFASNETMVEACMPLFRIELQ